MLRTTRVTRTGKKVFTYGVMATDQPFYKPPFIINESPRSSPGGLSYFYLLINEGICDFKRGLVVPLLPVHELSCGTIKMYLGTPLAACQ